MKPQTQTILDSLLRSYADLVKCKYSIAAAFDLISECYVRGGKILACGNGGSASDAEHLVGELMNKLSIRKPLNEGERTKLLRADLDKGAYIADHLQRAYPAISLVSQTSLCTAVANDEAGDMIFAQQVYGYGRPGDLLVAFSTSGNSSNVLNAAQTAVAVDMKVIGFTGESGGKLEKHCAVCIQVPRAKAYAIQELHLPVYHGLCAMIECELFGCAG